MKRKKYSGNNELDRMHLQLIFCLTYAIQCIVDHNRSANQINEVSLSKEESQMPFATKPR